MIRRGPREQQFTVLNTSIFNLRIPPDELGVYLHLLSKPDDWVVNGGYLCRHFEMSKDKGYRIINALVERGLITKRSYRDEQGRMATEYTVHEPTTGPENQERSSPENQDRSCFTGQVNQDVLSIDLTTTTTASSFLDSWEPSEQTRRAIRMRGILIERGWLEEFRVWAANPAKEVTADNVASKFVNWCKYERVTSARIKAKMPSTTTGAPQAHREYVAPTVSAVSDPEGRERARVMLGALVGNKRAPGGPTVDLEARRRQLIDQAKGADHE